MDESVKIYSKVTPSFFRKDSVLVDADQYDYSTDERLIITFVNDKGKIGFRNRNGEIVCEPAFDSVFGSCKKENQVVIDGISNPCGFKRDNGQVAYYEHLKHGLVDSTGALILEPKYNRIYTNEDCSAFVLCEGIKYMAQTRDGIELAPLGKWERNVCLKKVLNNKYWGVDEYGNYKSPFPYKDERIFLDL